MKYADGAMLGVDQNYGEAVGGLDCEQRPGMAVIRPSSGEGFVGGCVDAVNDVGMNLTERDEGPEEEVVFGHGGSGMSRPTHSGRRRVSFDGGAGVVFGEAEV